MENIEKERIINVHLTEDQYQKLRIISFYSARSISELVREAIDKIKEPKGKV